MVSWGVVGVENRGVGSPMLGAKLLNATLPNEHLSSALEISFIAPLHGPVLLQ